MIYNKHLIYSLIMYAIWSMVTLDPTSLDELKIDINIQDKASPRAQPNHEADYEHIISNNGYHQYFADEDCKCGIKNEDGIGPVLGVESGAWLGDRAGTASDLKDNITHRIGHGNPTAPHEYPWQVLLRNIKDPIMDKRPPEINIRCSGTLISTETILTAAHCVWTPDKNDSASNIYEIVAGIHNIRTPEPDATILKIKEVMVHPESTGEDDKGLPLYDSALIFLTEPVEWTENVQPICLPEKKYTSENVEALVTGWGRNEKNIIQEVLHEADLRVITDNTFCSTKGQICAGNPEQSVCNGDSGGPLIKKEEGDFYIQIGISSGAMRCDMTGVKSGISMYCDVYSIMPWIKKNIRGTNCMET